MEIDRLGDLRRQHACLFAIEGQAQLEEHILQAHAAQSDRPPAQVAAARGFDRIEIQVDHPIQLAHRQLHGFRQLVEIEESVVIEVAREIDRAKIADRSFLG